MKFDKVHFACLIDKLESMDSETFHHPVTSRDRPVAHRPHDHVHALRHQRNKIPKCIVCRGGLRNSIVRFRFYSMDQVWELHRILNEKDRDIVANQIVITFLSIEFNCKSSYISGKIGTSCTSSNG